MDDLPYKQFKIRAFRNSDLDAVMGMERACFPKHIAWTRAQYENILYDPELVFFVAYDGSTLAGSAFAFVNCGPDENETWFNGNVVGKQYRRQGLGREFVKLRLVVGALSGDESACVHIPVSNKASIAMHRVMGFEGHDRIRKYYGDVEDALCMRKVIKRW